MQQEIQSQIEIKATTSKLAVAISRKNSALIIVFFLK
jgi:hypothetical protein